ncbi:unnamed protein product [Closterium sp. Naga37s-1]|nr:unnamed protein product [Closterium sp. Naga37s-1]
MSGGSASGTELEWPATRVRDTFLQFFKDREHTHVPSSLVVPLDDPTLLFANAGMNQFKPIFLGTVDPRSPLASLKRAVNSQKCIRAGGKHNDLDDVGKDTYHHTFFEMLGNWSFGDYFKQEAITWAWELLTQVYKLPEDRLYATYFGGDEKLGLEPDLEARDIWLTVLPASRVLPYGCKDNFWEMGDTGPCGPCTEIHFDRLGGRDAAALVNADDPTCIEIWNNVFIQFNREADGTLKTLPAKHVDTGMGFERLTSILQGKLSNYDTDVFMPIFEAIQKVTGAAPYKGKLGKEDTGNKDMAYRVVADHIRTLSFAIADGARPGSDGRDYVLRRILRRAVRYGRDVLGAQEGFFSTLVPVFADLMGDTFPELRKHGQRIQDIISEEEAAFGRTLQKGLQRFEKAASEVKDGKLSGQDAFVLWDTFGFPVDLTQLMAEEKGLAVDMASFEKAMTDAREMSRGARSKGGAGALVMEAEATAELQKRGIDPTDDSPKYVWRQDHPTTVRAIFTPSGFVESVTATSADASAEVGLVLTSSSFYAEQGGQIFDTGAIIKPANNEDANTGSKFEVRSVQVYGGYVVHVGVVTGGSVAVDDAVVCQVDYDRRALVAPNHTCTHLLNHALKKVLGDHIDQKGSLVAEDRLRFDFSHGKPIDPKDLGKIEGEVVERVKAGLPVYALESSLADARRIMGLRAVFGEVYPDPVRVVSVGTPVEQLLQDPENPQWANSSIEFCGGTHISNTTEAESFAIISEEGIAKGVRRIIAFTTAKAKEAIALADQYAARIEAAGKLSGTALEKEVAALKGSVDSAVIPAAYKAQLKASLLKLHDRLRQAQKAAAGANLKLAIQTAVETAAAAAAAGESVCVLRIDVGLDPNAIREAVVTVLGQQKELAVLMVSVDEEKGKVLLYAGVPDAVAARGLSVLEWLRAALVPVEGKGGGGKGGLAQGQVPLIAEVALEAAGSAVESGVTSSVANSALQSVLDASDAAVGDANATGVIGLVVLKTDTDYNILYQAGVRVSDAGLPTSIAINSAAAGAGGSPVIEFSATEAAWQNYTWNGTRFGQGGNSSAGGAGGARRGAVVKAVLQVLAQFFPNLNATGAGSFFGGRGGGRGGPRAGFAYGFSGVWYNASTITNGAGRSYADVVAVDMLAAPSSFFGVVTTDAFVDGVVGGPFANHTRHAGGRGGGMRGGRAHGMEVKSGACCCMPPMLVAATVLP